MPPSQVTESSSPKEGKTTLCGFDDFSILDTKVGGNQ